MALEQNIGLQSLPAEILSTVVDYVVVDSTLSSGLGLRRVSRLFDTEIEASYFGRNSVDLHEPRFARFTANIGLEHLHRYLMGMIMMPQNNDPIVCNLRNAIEILTPFDDIEVDRHCQPEAKRGTTNPLDLVCTRQPHVICIRQPHVRHAQLTAAVALAVIATLDHKTFGILDRTRPVGRESKKRINPDAITDLHWAMVTAVVFGSTSTVDTFFRSRPEVRDPCAYNIALRIAIQKGDCSMVRLLLDRGTDSENELPVEATSPFTGTVQRHMNTTSASGHTQIVESLLTYRYNIHCHRNIWKQAIMLADEISATETSNPSSYRQIVQILLERGRSEELDRLTHLVVRYACILGNKEILQLVVKDETDVNNLNSNNNFSYSSDCYRLLRYAALYGNAEIVEFLLDAGVKYFRPRLHSMEAIYCACLSSHTEVLEILFQRSITMKEYGFSNLARWLVLSYLRNEKGESAFLKHLKLLCDIGLDLRTSRCGERLLLIAVRREHESVKHYLHEKGIVQTHPPDQQT